MAGLLAKRDVDVDTGHAAKVTIKETRKTNALRDDKMPIIGIAFTLQAVYLAHRCLYNLHIANCFA